jgi:uncharacterized membrane protein
MTYTPMLLVHICAGTIAVIAGSMALVVRKGSRLHRQTGDVFVVSMLFMAAGGAYLAFAKSQRINVIAGCFTFYLVASAWLTVARKAKELGRGEYALLLFALAIGLSALVIGVQSRGVKGSGAMAYGVFGTMTLLCAGGDIRMLVRGGVAGAQRLVRHLWRMGAALFIAAGSLFLGTASDPVLKRSGLRATIFTKEIRATHIPEVPVLIIVVLTFFWLFRVWFSSAYKKTRAVS